jgi:hypothetical protein
MAAQRWVEFIERMNWLFVNAEEHFRVPAKGPAPKREAGVGVWMESPGYSITVFQPRRFKSA